MNKTSINPGHMALEEALGTKPPWFVGVLNVTPDSFSDGGKYLNTKDAIKAGYALAEAGAHIIEIGGESTRSGSTPVSFEEEILRIQEIVQELSSGFFVSIDTYKSETAKRCLSFGARMINDVSALRADASLARVVKEARAFLVLMHSKEDGPLPHVSESKKSYSDVVREIYEFLLERISLAVKAGISSDRIIVDPGMGRFLSDDPKYSWELLSRIHEFRELGLDNPLMIGISRKGFLGVDLLDRDPLSQLTSLGAYIKGVDLIRTHNVKMAREFFTAWEKLELY